MWWVFSNNKKLDQFPQSAYLLSGLRPSMAFFVLILKVSKSWTQLLTLPGRAVCYLAATPALNKNLQGRQRGIRGSERRRPNNALMWVCSTLIFCHSYGTSRRCRGWDRANAVKRKTSSSHFGIRWKQKLNLLGGWFQPIWNRCSSNWTSSSKRGERSQNYSSCHHLASILSTL